MLKVFSNIKLCTKCGCHFPLSDFEKRNDRKSGRGPRCKFCIRRKNRGYHQRKKQSISKRKKQYYQKHKKKLNKRRAQYAKSPISKEKQKIYSDRHYEKNAKLIKLRKRIRYQENKEAFRARGRAYRREKDPTLRINDGLECYSRGSIGLTEYIRRMQSVIDRVDEEVRCIVSKHTKESSEHGKGSKEPPKTKS